ncbi:glycine C-acetyltransferase [Ancylomarina euxinus]|uniref:2-amino-3-ketobutyrate coenzyme A ligase n=1 Tax=Ancylomarina euxinus TaxID=2283627 RepID=A0A425Y7Y6_9BACT|nr:glycine C-acetyltransferase [Ancylomarina euxinus]MCZ4693539.1 glycine C-acetyltransferase [Ancylomarina euxinus]MUP13766.1 glycine C-acetyltransferase [Ancylomarina euxinus]RRG24596.1 glycine C-acetyltransferase [Ancylomarina euxinus]
MYGKFKEFLAEEIESIKESGLYKNERIITSAQGAEIKVNAGDGVLNFCANNYLGLSSHPAVIEGAKKGLDSHGYGMSSVRFICGTTDIHKELEQKIATFFGTEDTILYAAAFDANGGVFEPLFGKDDAIISDELNHASIIDGVRLSKSARYRYKHADMADLEAQLKVSQAQRFRIIVTDGVFSMDGDIAKLNEICDLADKYNALVMVDDSHASGFIGKTGRGTHEHHNCMDRVDIITSTLGKALGGGLGGFTTGKKEVIDMLRQRSRPYLFSNSLSPAIVGASIAVFDMLSASTDLRDKVMSNAQYFSTKLREAGFDVKPSESAINALMLYDAVLSQQFAAKLLEEGIYVIGFYFPVVPKEQARIRIQLSAAHTQEHLDKALAAFIKVGKELKVIE